jgi:hypothetical protein
LVGAIGGESYRLFGSGTTGTSEVGPPLDHRGLTRWVVLVGIPTLLRGVCQRKWVLPAVTGAFVGFPRENRLSREKRVFAFDMWVARIGQTYLCASGSQR